MCGFTGFWDFRSQRTTDNLAQTVRRMAAHLRARGPDSDGVWACDHNRLAFGHRRLSIRDLSPAGDQPMVSASGRHVIAYNGEIYNTDELRRELGKPLRGHSDTEILLEACEAWGVEATLKRCNGMFAFALWDSEKRTLTLARDRFGIKPLYWGFQDKILFFGSQLKSFKAHPDWKPKLNKDALISYFRFNYIPDPESIFQNMHKLEPGTLVKITALDAIKHHRYWDVTALAAGSRTTEPEEVLVEQLDQLLRQAVKKRMVADVPLGAFLSGGVDSSTVVALMQAQSDRPIHTFSIGFNEKDYNEAPYAKEVARHLKTDHAELYVTPADAQKVIPNLADWYDEPFADSSQIPTYLVSRFAREHVTVSLSGDGGDELFAGYNRYFLGQRIWQKMRLMPPWLRSLGARGIEGLSPKSWDTLAHLIPKSLRPRLVGDRAHKLAAVLHCKDSSAFYQQLVSLWDQPESLLAEPRPEKPALFWARAAQVGDLNFVEKMQLLDSLSYLPGDILTKVDRASMAVSLEARVPLLDHDVAAFAWRLPMSAKITAGGGGGKHLLRQVLYRYVPPALIDRPKVGFGVPIDAWLRGPLRDWAEDLLSEDALSADGLLNPIPIRTKWKDHLSGRRNWQYALWSILMFQAWRTKNPF